MAEDLSETLGGILVLIVDINDLGGEILGTSDDGVDRKIFLELLKQKPLGQADQCTPMGFLRPLYSDIFMAKTQGSWAFSEAARNSIIYHGQNASSK
jgi:hypothetical protein